MSTKEKVKQVIKAKIVGWGERKGKHKFNKVRTQSLSYKMQVSAAVRLIPSPPALVLRINIL